MSEENEKSWIKKLCCKKEYKKGNANYPRDPSLSRDSRNIIVLEVDDGQDCASRRCPCLKHPAWKCIGKIVTIGTVLSILLTILEQIGFVDKLYCASIPDNYKDNGYGGICN